MNYLYRKLQEAIFKQDTLERKAFAIHIALVAQALHDIEWVDSCGSAPGSENAAIRACVNKSQMIDLAERSVAAAATNLAIAQNELAHWVNSPEM